jgi:dienelactone hydrolase
MRTLALTLFAIAPLSSLAAPTAEPLAWDYGGTEFSGYLVYDDGNASLRPGLVMVPNWRGVNESAVEKAKAVASEGYVVLVTDMYGKDVRPKNNDEAGVAARAVYADRGVMRGRINAALATLRAQAGKAPLDPGRIAAFGFCFGGSTVLELARSGADIAGVVSLHGNLATSLPAQPGTLKASVLVLNGADDRSVPPEQRASFEQEMRDAQSDWYAVDFGGAVHCFAEADAGDDPNSNCRYHAPSAKRAYRMMYAFFDRAFAGD